MILQVESPRRGPLDSRAVRALPRRRGRQGSLVDRVARRVQGSQEVRGRCLVSCHTRAAASSEGFRALTSSKRADVARRLSHFVNRTLLWARE